jgi:UDP-glucose 4-epimerase
MSNRSTCVVFGGSGFLGQRLCKKLVEQGFRVRSVSRTGRPRSEALPWWDSVDWITADLGTQTAVPALIGADLVFHLASSTYPSSSNTDVAFDLESNLVGTVRMLESAVESHVKRVIFISSGGTVYGIPRENPIPETHPTDPICSYGIHKLAIEKYLYLYRNLHKLDSIVLRVSNMFGESQRLDRPLGAGSHFVHRAKSGKPIEIWGDGCVSRDFIHVDDVAEAMLRAADYRGPERIFNIGSGRSVQLNELIEFIQQRISTTVLVNHLPARTFDVRENVLDVSLAAREFNWKPAISLEAGIQRLLESTRPIRQTP